MVLMALSTELLGCCGVELDDIGAQLLLAFCLRTPSKKIAVDKHSINQYFAEDSQSKGV